MTYTRKDLWKLPSGWNDTLLWYARAITKMQERAITDTSSWRYLAAIHGFDENIWREFGYLGPEEPLPTNTHGQWRQCQHQSWYFLPWHRGYLTAFETAVRATIEGLPGQPPSDWALPYWDYSSSNNQVRTLPSPFTDPTTPDGEPNPLFSGRRFGIDGDGKIELDPADVALNALDEPDFFGSGTGGGTGFGGPETGFSHFGDQSANGQLESRPHNGVHVLVGGWRQGTDPNDPLNLGLMTNPDTAGLDPIFWLHHANIDRLWETWRARSPQHANPADNAWLTGPSPRHFVMPMPGNQTWTYAAKDVLDTRAAPLNYVYEDLLETQAGAPSAVHVVRATPEAVSVATARRSAVAKRRAELMGANDSLVLLQGAHTETTVQLEPTVTNKLARRSASAAASVTGGAAAVPDRVYLNLENIRSSSDAAAFYVYVNLPDDADPARHSERLAGLVSLFGVRKASHADDAHAGNGINEVFDITHIIDSLQASDPAALDTLSVRFVPRSKKQVESGPQPEVSVGRVSVYREEQQ